MAKENRPPLLLKAAAPQLPGVPAPTPPEVTAPKPIVVKQPAGTALPAVKEDWIPKGSTAHQDTYRVAIGRAKRENFRQSPEYQESQRLLRDPEQVVRYEPELRQMRDDFLARHAKQQQTLHGQIQQQIDQTKQEIQRLTGPGVRAREANEKIPQLRARQDALFRQQAGLRPLSREEFHNYFEPHVNPQTGHVEYLPSENLYRLQEQQAMGAATHWSPGEGLFRNPAARFAPPSTPEESAAQLQRFGLAAPGQLRSSNAEAPIKTDWGTMLMVAPGTGAAVGAMARLGGFGLRRAVPRLFAAGGKALAPVSRAVGTTAAEGAAARAATAAPGWSSTAGALAAPAQQAGAQAVERAAPAAGNWFSRFVGQPVANSMTAFGSNGATQGASVGLRRAAAYGIDPTRPLQAIAQGALERVPYLGRPLSFATNFLTAPVRAATGAGAVSNALAGNFGRAGLYGAGTMGLPILGAAARNPDEPTPSYSSSLQQLLKYPASIFGQYFPQGSTIRENRVSPVAAAQSGLADAWDTGEKGVVGPLARYLQGDPVGKAKLNAFLNSASAGLSAIPGKIQEEAAQQMNPATPITPHAKQLAAINELRAIPDQIRNLASNQSLPPEQKEQRIKELLARGAALEQQYQQATTTATLPKLKVRVENLTNEVKAYEDGLQRELSPDVRTHYQKALEHKRTQLAQTKAEMEKLTAAQQPAVAAAPASRPPLTQPTPEQIAAPTPAPTVTGPELSGWHGARGEATPQPETPWYQNPYILGGGGLGLLGLLGLMSGGSSDKKKEDDDEDDDEPSTLSRLAPLIGLGGAGLAGYGLLKDRIPELKNLFKLQQAYQAAKDQVQAAKDKIHAVTGK